MPPRNRKSRLGEHALPLVFAGIAVWAIGALMVRVFPVLFESRWRTLALLFAMVPLAEIALMVLGAVLGLERAKRLPAAAWLGIVIIGCHALALVLWPTLYGADALVVHHGAAWLAWTGAAPILCAWIAAERQ